MSLRVLGDPPGHLSAAARRWVVSHGASRLVQVARAALYGATAVLHTEDHDPTTNGERRVLEILGDGASCIFDVGANEGTWAVLAEAACPRATVHCFELVEPVRRRLQQQVAGLARIRVADSGLLDVEGTVPVKYYGADTEVSSVADYPHPMPAVWRTEPVTTGDAFLRSSSVERVDLLKVDAEGADLRVLHGFERSLRAGLIDVVQFEYGFAGILTGALLYEFHRFLEPMGFVIGRIAPGSVDFGRYQLTDERFFGPNFLAVRRHRDDLIDRLAAPGKRRRITRSAARRWGTSGLPATPAGGRPARR